jgi:hypothetical protein
VFVFFGYAGILSVHPRLKTDDVRDFVLRRFIYPEKRDGAKHLVVLNQAGQVVSQNLNAVPPTRI